MSSSTMVANSVSEGKVARPCSWSPTPSSIVVKNIWSCTSTHLPPVACYLTTFTFILYFKFCNKHYDSHLLGKRRKKGKAIPVQACTGPEGSRRLRLPDFKTIGT